MTWRQFIATLEPDDRRELNLFLPLALAILAVASGIWIALP